MKLTAFRSLAIFMACLTQSVSAETQGFGGRWEYRQPPDTEGEVLVLRIEKDICKGEYLGLEREGEHGLFYTATEIANLEIIDSDIRFIVPRRNLFIRRPINAAEARAWAQKSAGFSRVELRFEGHLTNGRLDLTCEGRDCPDSQMIFQLKEFKLKKH